MNIYREALEVQNACNFTAVSGLLNTVCKEILNDGEGMSAVVRNPAVILIMDKLKDLMPSENTYHSAYETCVEKCA